MEKKREEERKEKKGEEKVGKKWYEVREEGEGEAGVEEEHKNIEEK